MVKSSPSIKVLAILTSTCGIIYVMQTRISQQSSNPWDDDNDIDWSGKWSTDDEDLCDFDSDNDWPEL